MDIYQESVDFHKEIGGKLEVTLKKQIETRHDLSLQYTPGVAEPCRRIHQDPKTAYDLTIKKNTVAVVSDGSAVLGLGNIGGLASLPVMEGKAALFKAYANIDAFPICINTQKTEEIIELVKNIAPTFGGINLEDISAPRCFEIEAALQEIGIPVFHDDQHGTAIVVMAGLINATKLAKKPLSSLKVVINGAGAAGTAITEMLLGISTYKNSPIEPVNDVILCDSKGIICEKRPDIANNPFKVKISKVTNKNKVSGNLAIAMKNSDVFIGVSVGNVVNETMIKSMNKDSIIFAMSNPTPEIMPDLALKAGAFIVGTGRSDFPNQVNNVLAFPGIFRGALDAKAKTIDSQMKFAAAIALAESVKKPTPEYIIPSTLDKKISKYVAKKVYEAYLKNKI